MNKNIVILGFDYRYNISIAELLNQSLDMYFLDVNQYVNYALFSKSEMLEKCGIEYLNTQENKAIKSCAEFENTIMCIPNIYFFRSDNYKLFKENSFIVYLYQSKEKLLRKVKKEDFSADLLIFEDKDNELNNICNKKIIITNKKKESVVNEILKSRGEYEY